MKNKHNYIYFIALLIIVSGITIVLTQTNWLSPDKYIRINGTVTEYDVTPSFSDGGIVFKVNDTAIDIGGGLRPSNVMGKVYSPIQIGDEVEVKALNDKSGYITLYGCQSCYVRKK